MVKAHIRGDMPITFDPRHPYGTRPVRVGSVQAAIFGDANARQAMMNHKGATLDQLRDRGGVTAVQAVAILSCLAELHVGEDEAHRILYAMNSIYNGGKIAGAGAALARAL